MGLVLMPFIFIRFLATLPLLPFTGLQLLIEEIVNIVGGWF